MNAPPPFVIDGTREFLRRHAPFNRIPDAILEPLIPRLALAYFPVDTLIAGPALGPAQHLQILQRGLVGIRSADVLAHADPTLSPGECFPIASLTAGTAPTRQYTAVQDSFCLLLSRDDFIALRRDSSDFDRYCTAAVTETLKQSLAHMQTEYSRLAQDQQTLAQPVGQLVRRPAVICAESAPLLEALERMRDEKVRTIVIADAAGAPAGIFTLIDLLERVVLMRRSLDVPIGEVMSPGLVTLAAQASAAEALQLLAERGIRQLGIVEGARVVGLISERDLFALQRVSMRQVGESLRTAKDRASLRDAADDIRSLTKNLLAQGAAAEPLTRTIASFNDTLTRRVIELALTRHDLGNIRWCWLALGSEGRGEQTFATDQDNALIFAASADASLENERSALLAFARDVNAELDAVGFPLCTGNVMAGNAELCLTEDEWRGRFMQWLREPTPQALLGANIMFDFRPLYGDAALSRALRDWLDAMTPDSKIFLRLMAQNALDTEPPLGLVRAFVTDDEPEHKGSLDLKARGTRLFVDAARVFGLAFGLTDTGTANRLRAAGAQLNVEARYIAAAIDAFHFLQLLRLREQHVSGDRPGGNRIDPYALNDIDQRMLKEAFRQARQLQQRLKALYHL